jgi:hypothetical protein
MCKKYLGQFPIEIWNTEFVDFNEQAWALTFIEAYGQIDGSHHKTWVLDQVARILLGTKVIVEEERWENDDGSILRELRFWTDENTTPQYKRWVQKMLGDELDGEFEYDYDKGIAP